MCPSAIRATVINTTPIKTAADDQIFQPSRTSRTRLKTMKVKTRVLRMKLEPPIEQGNIVLRSAAEASAILNESVVLSLLF